MTGRRRPRRCCYTCLQCRTDRKPLVCEHPETDGRNIEIKPGYQVPDWCPEIINDKNRRKRK